MIEDFKNNLKNRLKLKNIDKVLLAISGGADSVAMLDLFSNAGYNCGIAHCNFHLRNQESDGDEELVKKLSEHYNFPFYKSDFDTSTIAAEKGISIEMAARELRYDWFEKIRHNFDYQYIATAHHGDDVLETFFINLTRGTGIRGLSGINEKHGNIIRPMLFTDRKAILKYISDNKLNYREDSTNSDIKIIRNRFRHQILPMLKEINLAAEENIMQTIENLKDIEIIVNQKLAQLKTELGIIEKYPVNISIAQLKKIKPLSAYFFEILKPYGYNASQVKNIIQALDAAPGKVFHSKTHQLVKDRDKLVITSIVTKNSLPLNVSGNDKIVNLESGKKLIIEKIWRTSEFKIPTDTNIAALDFDKLKFPLRIRGWEQGDHFHPLGMKQKKKLSDFFIDEKFSLIDKQNALLLVSDNQIVWVIGKRLDNKFKITDKTENILLIKLI